MSTKGIKNPSFHSLQQPQSVQSERTQLSKDGWAPRATRSTPFQNSRRAAGVPDTGPLRAAIGSRDAGVGLPKALLQHSPRVEKNSKKSGTVQACCDLHLIAIDLGSSRSVVSPVVGP